MAAAMRVKTMFTLAFVIVSVSADFCGDYQTTCVATNDGVAYTDCASQTSSMAPGTSGATSGDTLACRAYHLVRAILTRSPVTRWRARSPESCRACALPEHV